MAAHTGQNVDGQVNSQRQRSRMDESGLRAHVEHIRTVHFTLVIVSFAVLASSTLSRRPAAQRAVEQLRAIDGIVALWDDEWLERQVSRAVQPVADSIMALTNTPLGVGLYLTVDRTWCPADSEYEDLYFYRPTTLAQFVDHWDQLAHLGIAHLTDVPNRAALWYRNSRTRNQRVQVGVSPLTDSSSLDTSRHLRVHLAHRRSVSQPDDVVRLFGAANPWVLASEGPDPRSPALFREWYRVVAGVETDIDTLELQRPFADSNAVRWAPGPFSRTFRDLAAVAGTYADLDLDKIDTILQAELARTGDHVEVFGAHLPVEALAFWGGPVLLVIQLYLALHLTGLLKLRHRGLTRFDAPWIGLYDGVLPQAVTLTSCGAFPAIVLLVLWIQQLHSGDGGAWWALAWFVAGVGLACWITYQLIAVQRRIRVDESDGEGSTAAS